MLMIRFQRIGRKNDPAFRIVVLPKTSGPKAGRYVDLVGTYNPKTKAITLKPDAIKDWISKGAQVSPTVHNLLVSQGVIEGKKINVLPKKTPPKKEEAPVAEAAAPAAEPVAEEVAPTEAEVAADAEEVSVAEAEVEAAPVAEEVPAEEAPAEAEEVKAAA